MDIDDSYLKQLDAYIGAKLVVPGQDSVPVLPTIFKRKRYSQGLAVGKVNTKPILDSRMYEFEYPQGRIEEYSVNSILESLLKQTDKDGSDSAYLEEITSSRSDPDVAINNDEDAFATIGGRRKPIITTKGWDIKV